MKVSNQGAPVVTSERLRVFVTIDTECSLPSISKGGDPIPVGTRQRVYGELSGRRYGVPLIMDSLEEHGFKGTFFCDVCMKYLVGEADTAEVLTDIANRGHDVQLHLHPIYRLWATRDTAPVLPALQWSDHIGALPEWFQDELIKEGRSFIEQHTGRAPTVFRAGNYGASDETLRLLAANGFEADSSYNLWTTNVAGYGARINASTPTNVPFRHEGVLEFPVTCFSAGIGRSSQYRFFAPEGASFREMEIALRRLRAAGVRDVVVVLHSFSFVKARDPNYRRVRFNWVAYRRFHRLLRHLADHKDVYEVLSMGEYLADKKQPKLALSKLEHFVQVPRWAAALRLVGQAVQYGL